MTEVNRDMLHAVSYGNLENVRDLIYEHGINSSEAHGYVLLRESIKRQRKEITKFLLNSGSKVNSKRSQTIPSNTPLHLAIQNRDLEITEMLLDHDADINARNESGLSPLLKAIQDRQENIVDILLKRGAILNSCNKGISPLHYAVERHFCNTTEKLLQYGAYVDSKANFYCRKEEYTPLHCATENEDFEIVKILLKKGANVNSTTADGHTPLHLACKTGNVETIDLLLSNNVDINARAHNKLTPLYIAVENSRREAAKFLMDHEAQINDEFDNGKTILSCAVDKRLSLIVNDILQYSPDVNNIINKKSFRTALNSLDSEIVENMVKYGFSVDHEDINDTALLHNAIKMGNTKIIQDLIKHGLDLTCSKAENSTVLHIAIKNKQFEVAKLLLTNGADVNATDESEKPPIYYSTYNSDVNMTKLLLSHGANVQKRPELLRIATNKLCKEIIEILLEKQVDIDATDKFGRTALHMTASQEYEGFCDFLNIDDTPPEVIKTKAEIAKILLINGANVNAKTTKNRLTALHIACVKQFINVVEVLLEFQADVDCVAKGFTPLHIAAEKGNSTIIEMLVKHNMNIVNSKQENGDTALHIAAKKGHQNALEILLKNGADVNLKNNKHETALHLAAKGSKNEIVSILLDHMSPIDSKNIYGNTPLHIAVESAKTDNIHVLLNFGSDINILNNKHCTAIDLAKSLRYNGFARYGDYDDEEGYERYVNIQESFYDEKNRILRTLLLHAITLKAINLYPAKTDLYSFLDDNSLLKFLQEDCENEIKLLKVDTISGNTKLSFYDVLTKSIHSLTRCVKNEDVVRIFESDDYKEKFPIYAGIIERNFKKATQRRQLLDSAYEFFKCYFEMPYECVDQILSYLSIGDLENIMDSWKI
ncbi:ankyrin-1-like [Episyrphus balteatus]|uniref:ankyrin-1-like n=1 Tax=Episyrphus balteatus TaxID=286459 RepID=UPI002485A977|nr:ankyrin-1-like [Episyrphus balteatus]